MGQDETVKPITAHFLDFVPQLQVLFKAGRDQAINLTQEVPDESYEEMKRKCKQVTKYSANPQKDKAFAIGLEHFDVANFNIVLNHIKKKVKQDFEHNGRLKVGKCDMIVLKRVTPQSSGGS